MLTRANISYNLHTSPHSVAVVYGDQIVTFHFSSELYTHKFRDRLNAHREEISASLTNRFGVTVYSDILADLRLYKTIEKRGYLISIDGEKIECQENITLDGLRMTAKP